MRLFFTLTLLCLSNLVYAHEFFFSFAEMEYNATSKHFELTIQASTHDVELALRNQGLNVKELEFQTRDSIIKKGLEQWLNKGFQVSSSLEKAEFSLIGFEVLPNGLMYAYLESKAINLENELHIQYDLLMSDFPEQQNKLTFTASKIKQTAVFLPSKTEETLIIKP